MFTLHNATLTVLLLQGVTVTVVQPGAIQTSVMMDREEAPNGSYIDRHFANVGMNVDVCAEGLSRAIAARRDESWILAPRSLEQLGFYVSHYFPWLYPTLIKWKLDELCNEWAD